MVSAVCSVSGNVPSASSLKYKQAQPSQGWGTLAHGLRLRTGCVATVKPFCVQKPSHLHGLAELEQTPAMWVRGRREHHPTLLGDHILLLYSQQGFWYFRTVQVATLHRDTISKKMTKILKNTEVFLKPLSFLFFFFFSFLKLEHIACGKEGEPPLGFRVGVGELKKIFFGIFLAYCKAS